jgi:hypothetical protein
MDMDQFEKFADSLVAVGYVEAAETILKLIDVPDDDEDNNVELDIDEDADLSDEDLERIDRFTKLLDSNKSRRQADHLRKTLTNFSRRRR